MDLLGAPLVVKDHNSKTAIITKVGRKYIHVIPMKSGKLTMKKMTSQQYIKAKFEVLDIPMLDAVRKFLAHAGGYTEAVKAELERVQNECGTKLPNP
jgi:hypothetical protein